MNKKGARRLLAVLLSLVMLVGAVPVAFAAEPEPGGVTWKQVDNSAVTARPRQTAVTEEPETPLYADDEIVRVSIVLEAAPTIAVYSAEDDISENTAAMSYRQQLLMTQEYVTEAIAEETLDPGEKLDVVYNLTLVANVISANVAYGEIEKIKTVEGVEDVVVATRYTPDVVSVGGDDPQMEVSTGMTGASIAWSNGYTGAGMRIAIIDTGLDIEHQSFNSAAYDYAIAEDAENDGVTVASYDLLDKDEIAGKLDQLNASAMYAGLDADDLYISSKIPFGFNYVDRNLNVEHLRDLQGEHGSHVAGIAAANRYLNENGTFVSALDTVHMVGNAPDAQVLVMKVFGQGGGAYSDDYVAAIEDAIILGCDTVNLSLGSSVAGMAYDAAFSGMLESLSSSGTVVTISAGNSGAWADETAVGNLYGDDVNYQTGGSPGSYTNSLGVASVDNDGVVSPYFTVDGKLYSFTEGSSASNEPFVTLDTNGGEGTKYDYIFIDGMGDADDYTALGDLVKGKIVFCSRGSINFSAKAQNAYDAGAAACVVYNNAAGTISMTLSGYTGTAPCVSISQTAGRTIKAASTKATTESDYTYYTGKLTVFNKVGVANYNSAYQTMSSFSSWGVPGDLSIKPEITAPGGNIYSLFGENMTQTGITGGHDQYELMSGTSMAAPQMAGIGALVKQAIEQRGISQKGLSDRALAQSLMMSTATPLTDEYGDYYSVLQQGAGLVNADAATAADSYVLVKGQDDGKVKVELGDDPGKTGTYSFTFTIQNLDGDVHGYNLSADVFTQYPAADSNDNLYMTGYTAGFDYASVDWTIDGKPVDHVDDLTIYDFDGDGDEDRDDAQALLDYVVGSRTSITNKALADFDNDGGIDTYDVHLFLVRLNTGRAVVPANSSVTVTCTITLDQNEAAELLETYPNGFYVEAYAKIDALPDSQGAVSTSHSIPVLGFYGNWSDASMFDKGGYVEYGYGLEDRLPYLYNGQTLTMDSLNLNSNVLLVRYAGDSDSYYFGVNPYVTDETYMPERAALNNQRGDVLASWKYSAIRTPAASRVTATNVKTGKVVLDTGDMGSSYAAYWYATNNAWQNITSNVRLNWNGAGVLNEGDTVELKLTLAPELYVDNATGDVDWDALGKGASRTVQVTIDNTAPVISDVKYDEAAGTLTVTASDNQYVAAAFLINKTGSTVLARTGSIADIKAGAEGSYTLTLPEENTETDLLLQVYDYADNASTWKLTLGEDRTAATSIEIVPAATSVFVGSTTALEVSTTPWNAYDTFTWSSDDETVATVDADGVVTGVSVGSCTITAKSTVTESVTAQCAVTVKTVVADLNGIVWGTDSKPDWSTFSTNALADYTAVKECGYEFSAATQTVDGKIYAAVLSDDASDADIYLVDDGLNATKIGNVNADIGVVDLEDSPSLGCLVGVYGKYILFLDKGTGEMVDFVAWGDGSSSLVGIAYAGSVMNTNYNKMIDLYYLVDSSGMVYFDAVIELDDGCHDFYPQSSGKGLVASTGYTAGDFYSSLLYAADNSGTPYLFWSRYNGSEVQDLIAIDVDSEEIGVVHLGEFADGVWPVVGLMSDLPAQSSGETTTALASAVANTNVEKTGIEPASETLTYRGPAGGLNSVEVGGSSGSAYEVKVDSATHTVTVPVVAGDSTNGLFTVNYDAAELTLLSVNYGNVLHSAVIDSAKGQVKVGYADAEAYSGLVASLVFTYMPTSYHRTTDVALTVSEDGASGTVKTDRTTLILPGEFTPGPSQPTQPTNPDKPTDPKKGFDDVKQGDWFYDEVTDLADKGYINGVSDNLFAPNQNLSRGMLVTILYRMDGEKAVTATGAFSDVVKDSWYEQAVNWAAANGIVYGYDDGRFGPNDMVTRQQMAAILWRYAQYKGLDVAANGTVLPDFPDRNEIATWAGEAVSWAYSRGVMTGKTGGKLDPNGNASRAEAAVMLYRFMKLSPKGDKR